MTIQTSNSRRSQPNSRKNNKNNFSSAAVYVKKTGVKRAHDEESFPNQDIEDGFMTDNGEIDPEIKEENFMDVENTQAP
jgi:hypothetical protein